MITYTQASTIDHLEQILLLQQQNLPKNLTDKEKEREGFLTVEHSFEVLKAMNEECRHIIALENGKVVAYALCMHPKFAESIEVLRPMFQEISQIVKGKKNYMVMGQICVAKTNRGQGIFRKLYETMKEKLPEGFDTIITEVDAKNQRSVNAHKAIGFSEIKRYKADGKVWSLITLK